MNKDVIYIEPEDDITDIITKIEKSKEKIIALVPPKKAGVFRSIVNVKLISKASASAEKSVVLVTMDPSIIKLAAATKLPVAKNLQSAPAIPTVGTEEEPANEHTIEDLPDTDDDDPDNEAGDGAALAAAAGVAAAGAAYDLADSDADDTSSAEHTQDDNKAAAIDSSKASDKGSDIPTDKPPRKSPKSKPIKPSGNKVVNWFKAHKKLAIAGGVTFAALIGFMVWAFGFAPAVDISVAIKTDSRNFSEGITFTDQLSSEDAKAGKFYLEQKKLESTEEIAFDATGQKNLGDKATGEVTVIATVPADGGTKVINTGDTFTINGLSYTADNSVTMHYDGKDDSVCKNADSVTKREFNTQGCRIYAKVKVTATQAGEKYNISAASNGWNTTASVEVYSESAMSGGTNKIVTVVQQSDIEAAKAKLTTAKEDENKSKLYATIGDEYLIIESTFTQETSAATATPAADQEVSGNTQPKLTATTTTSVYVINKDKLKEFVREKADLEDGQKVYDVKDVYIENFTNNGASSTAKLKAQYFVGPKITESEVVDRIKGKGLGDAQREIRDLYGVSDVKINTSYPWVMAIPGDTNKVTVKFEVKDQDGNEVKEQNSQESSSDSSDSSDSSNSSSNSNNTSNSQKSGN